MWIYIVMLVAGLALLVFGADWFVRGATSLARRLGVSSLVIGLTLVAFGTSLPELVVNVYAALSGTTDIALGNILGSNIANIALILGLAALISPVIVSRSTIWKEIPFALAAVLAVVILAQSFPTGQRFQMLDRRDGLLLLAGFLAFLWYISRLSKQGNNSSALAPEISGWRTALLIVVGLGALVVGGKFVVDAAVAIATVMGVSERVIGLTIVAVGTSLPELATSLVAAYRKQSDIAVGNIIGSNIFNVFFVLGISSLLQPLPFSSASVTDALIAVVFTVLLFAAMFVGKRHILERWQGGIFVALYAAYLVWLI